jgi:RsiW-degrading membrane proteinase PrsW (M82 family)
MHELVDLNAMDRLFLLAAVLLPILGLAAGAALGARTGNPKRPALSGLAIGLLGPLILALWRLYNAITDRLGLDTVRNLVVNLIVFVAAGLIIGFAVGLVARRGGGERS